MAGVVVIAGVYPPGSVVGLYRLADERVLAPSGGELVGRAIVDEASIVGWDGLETGFKYVSEGYVAGNYVTVRATATDAEAPSMELAQPPLLTKAGSIGTQEDPPVAELPAPPDPELGLPTGAPDAAPAPFVEPDSGESSAPSEPEAPTDGEAAGEPATEQDAPPAAVAAPEAEETQPPQPEVVPPQDPSGAPAPDEQDPSTAPPAA